MTDPTLRTDALYCLAVAVVVGLVLAAAMPALTHRDAPASLASHRPQETTRR